jgi:hypothetical protein
MYKLRIEERYLELEFKGKRPHELTKNKMAEPNMGQQHDDKKKKTAGKKLKGKYYHIYIYIYKKKKLHGLSPRANYI